MVFLDRGKVIVTANGSLGTPIVGGKEPTVIVTNPKPNAKLRDKFVTIQGIADGDRPVTRIWLKVNGKEGFRVHNVAKPVPGQQSAEWTIELEAGENRLQVLAESSGGTGRSREVVVIVEERRPRLIVLAIGVGAFSNKGVRRLPKAKSDALAIKKVFLTHSKDKGLFREVIVTTVTNEEANRQEILRALGRFSVEMTDEDVGVVFFAGHGKRDKTLQLYLYGHDIDPGDLITTGIPGSQLKATLSASKGKRILLLDACYAGAINETERADRGSPDEELARDLGKIENGLIVFCSSRGDEESKEDVRNGYFTQAVVEGLSGEAAPRQWGRLPVASASLCV